MDKCSINSQTLQLISILKGSFCFQDIVPGLARAKFPTELKSMYQLNERIRSTLNRSTKRLISEFCNTFRIYMDSDSKVGTTEALNYWSLAIPILSQHLNLGRSKFCIFLAVELFDRVRYSKKNYRFYVTLCDGLIEALYPPGYLYSRNYESSDSEWEPQMFKAVKGAVSSVIPEIPPVGVEITPETRTFLNDLLSRFKDGLSVDVNHSFNMPSLPGMPDVTQFFSKIIGGGVTTKVFMFLGYVGLTYFTFKYVDNKFLKGAVALLGLIVASYHIPYVEKLIDNLTSINIQWDDMEAQAGLSVDGMKMLLAPLLMCIHYITFSGKGDINYVKKFMEGSRMFKGIHECVSFSLDWCVSSCKDFLVWTGLLSPTELMEAAGVNFPELVELSNRIDGACLAIRNGARMDREMCLKIVAIEHEVKKLMNKIPNTREFMGDKRAALDLIKLMEPLTSRLAKTNFNHRGARIEPYAFTLHGNTSVGKSTVMYPMIFDIMSDTLPDDKLVSFANDFYGETWCYDPTNPFYDGYDGQFCVIVDEFGHNRDSAGTPDPTFEFYLRAVNLVEFPLHSADLCDKGSKVFISPMVFATSNVIKLDAKSMVLPAALARRMNSWLHFPAPEYTTDDTLDGPLHMRKMDLTKVRAEFGLKLDFSVYRFKKLDVMSGLTSGPVHTYNELMQIVSLEYRQNQAKGENLQAKHVSVKDAGLARRLETIARDDPERAEAIRLKIEENREARERAIEGRVEAPEETRLQRWYAFCEVHGISRETIKDMISRGLIAAYDHMSIVCDVFTEYMRPATDLVGDCIAKIVEVISINPIITAAVSALSIFSVCWYFFSSSFSSESGAAKATSKKVVKAKRPNRRVRRNIKDNKKFLDELEECAVEFVPQGINMNDRDICVKIFKSSSYYMYVGDKLDIIGRITFVKDRKAICPRHFMTGMEELYENDGDYLVKFIPAGAIKTGFNMMYSDLKECWIDFADNVDNINKEKDIQDKIYIDFPDTVPNHKNIIHHFVKDGSPCFKRKFDGALMRIESEPIPMYSLESVPCYPAGLLTYDGNYVSNAIGYDIATKLGECGSLLFDLNSHTILGIHVAGNGSAGRAMVVTREELEAEFGDDYYNTLEISGVKVVDKTFTRQMYYDISQLDEHKFTVVGHSDDLPAMPIVSSIEASPLNGQIYGESKYGIAHLRPARNSEGVMIDPMTQARMNYSNESACFNVAALCSVTDNCISSFFSVSDKPDNRVIDRIPAIEGDGEMEGFSRKSSAGWPYNKKSALGGKRDFFGIDGPFEFTSDRCKKLFDVLDEQLDSMKKGRRCQFVYLDFIKDETLKLSKIRDVKSRAISACPVDYLIHCRQYFGNLVKWMIRNRIKNGCAVGINVYSAEWDNLYSYLTSHGSKAIFGDYTNYDSKLPVVLMYMFKRFYKAFYSGCPGEDDRVRDILFEDVVNSVHITNIGGKGVYFEWRGSNPSGTFLTTCLNCFCNLVALRYAMADIMCKPIGGIRNWKPTSGINFSEIESNVKFTVFGDDNGFVMTDYFQSTYGVIQDGISASMALIGMIYTDENKETNPPPFTLVEERTFLKRGFRWESALNRWVAPLSLTSILESVQWKKKSTPICEMDDVVQRAIYELALHGKGVFDEWAPVIISKSRELLEISPSDTEFKICRARCISLDSYYL